MNDLDQLLRDGLRRAATDVPDTPASVLAARLVAARAGTKRRKLRRVALVAASILVLGVVSFAAVHSSSTGSDAEQVRAVDDPTGTGQSVGFERLGPGWHRVDTGPVPAPLNSTYADDRVSMAWTGSDLVVASEPSADPGSGMFAYSPVAGTWRRLPPLPFEPFGRVSLAWTGTDLVAVDEPFPASRAAAWDPVNDEWRDIGHPPAAAALIDAGVAPRPTFNGVSLVWTGQRLLDLTHGSAWDPSTGVWSLLALPEGVSSYAHLARSDPVWTGSEVVLLGWSTQTGLAWNPTGSTVRAVAGLPPDIAGSEDAIFGAAAIFYEGEIVLVSGDFGRVAALDVKGKKWRRLPDVPDMRDGTDPCSPQMAVIADRLLVQRCGGRPVELDGDHWQPVEPAPYAADHPSDRWAAVDGKALVAWSASDDPNVPADPHVDAAVWIPPRG